MAIHLTATGWITVQGSPIRLGLNHVDHSGVNHVATFPVNPYAHSLARDGPVNQNDSPMVPGEHRPAGNRAFDTQVENRFNHANLLKDNPRKLEVVVEEPISAGTSRQCEGLTAHALLKWFEVVRSFGAQRVVHRGVNRLVKSRGQLTFDLCQTCHNLLPRGTACRASTLVKNLQIIETQKNDAGNDRRLLTRLMPHREPVDNSVDMRHKRVSPG